MRYTIKSELHTNVNIFQENKLAHRAYFIPFEDRDKLDATTYMNERYNSDRVQVLSGEWDFMYYRDAREVPANFDFDMDLPFVKVDVPCSWQRTGYENPCYLNSRYEFALKPPVMPAAIPMALYRKQFILNDINNRFIITFLGVAANISLYVNGDYVGYSEGAHNMNEFDITSKLNQGSNEVLVAVHKWCNGSYLECQDMFRENGIFRDVYITECAKTSIYDYHVITNKNGNGYDLALEIDVTNPMAGDKVNVEVLDANGEVFVTAELDAAAVTKFNWSALLPLEWSAEIPNLYKMYITLISSNNVTVFRSFIGFKTVEIKGELYLFNGQNIKMKGVNHHDTDAENGWVMTLEQLENDVKIIKEYNCNTIRMSHYPPDPTLITICDHYGLYVVDEADIECHGIYSNPLNQQFGRISDKLMWKNHFLDRVQNMYFRDRNHPCIAMWSLGNESGGEKCHNICYDYLKTVTSIPVHYEGVIHTKRHSYDVISQMYAHSNHVKAVGEHELDNKWKGKPYFLCEYVHSMGVGPGGLSAYMDIFYKYDNILGGCIWEFCDHAVLHKNGKYKYTYGGDHGEVKHDGNFCVDGLFFPDRTPSTGALNMKNQYRPVLAKLMNTNTIQFTNTNRFLNSSYIDCKWQVLCGGVVTAEGVINLNIKPKSFIDCNIDCGSMQAGKDRYINISYIDKKTSQEIAFEQILIDQAKYEIALPTDGKMTVTENKSTITMLFNRGTLIYDLQHGEIVSYTYNNVEFINESPHHGVKGLLPNLYRGEIDNDRFIKMLWTAIGYNRIRKIFCKATYTKTEQGITIVSKYKMKSIGNIATVYITLDIDNNGVISVTAKAMKGLKLAFYSDVPRFGTTLEMPKEFNNVEYYGMGDKENLSDFNEHSKLGVFKTKVADMHEPYLMPQDSGNRTGVRYAKVTDDSGRGLVFLQGDNYLNFNANHFTLDEQLRAKHTEDLVECDTTNISIDGLYRGAGSQSCGQGPLPSHKPNIRKPFSFNYKIIPAELIK